MPDKPDIVKSTHQERSVSVMDTAPVSSAPLDFARNVEMFGGDTEKVEALIGELLKMVEGQLAIISQSLLEMNLEVVCAEAHSIKGGAAVLSAYQLSKAAGELESCAKTGGSDQVAEAVAKLGQELSRLGDFYNGLKS